jgi:hypothetical protein
MSDLEAKTVQDSAQHNSTTPTSENNAGGEDSGEVDKVKTLQTLSAGQLFTSRWL